MRTLSNKLSFWVAAAVAAIALWTSAAPTITYPLYAAEWHLTPVVTTAIFALYPLTLVIVLLVFGNLSDYIGRRNTILIGLLASLAGVLLFAIAPSIGWIFAGRVLMGIGVALSLSPATAAAVDFSPAGQEHRASSVTTAATAAGLVLATVVGGALIQYAPLPTHLNFAVLAVVIAVVAGFAWFLPRHSPVEAQGAWRPRAITAPRGVRRFFVVAIVAVTAAYAVGVLFLSLGADIAQTLIGSTNALVNGSIIGLNALAVGVAAIAARRLRPASLVLFGGITSILGLAALLLSSDQRSPAIFLVAAVVSGIGYALLFSGGLTFMAIHAPAQHRAGMLSAVYLVAYLFQGSIALLLGAIATAGGLRLALDLGSAIIALLVVAALVLAVTIGRSPAAGLNPSSA
jgi:MFS family permease